MLVKHVIVNASIYILVVLILKIICALKSALIVATEVRRLLLVRLRLTRGPLRRQLRLR